MTAARPLRSDARRNLDRLLEAARSAFAEHGAETSLEEVARRAGVGIGTLYRHFPTRQALLEAVFGDGLDRLAARAETLLGEPLAEPALRTWLRELADDATASRGLAASVTITMADPTTELYASCKAMRSGAEALLDRCRREGAIRPDLELAELLMLVHGIAWASEQVTGASERVDRLLLLLMEGLRPRQA